jgi:hypothetical protein
LFLCPALPPFHVGVVKFGMGMVKSGISPGMISASGAEVAGVTGGTSIALAGGGL